MAQKYVLRLVNNSSAPRTVILEPWADEHEWPTGSRLDLVVEGDSTNPLELQLDDASLTIYAPGEGSLLTALRNGEDLNSEHGRSAG